MFFFLGAAVCPLVATCYSRHTDCAISNDVPSTSKMGVEIARVHMFGLF